jgi:CRISPR-associated protein Csx3
MTNLLPAVLIGGPPRTRKSVLGYSLSLALHERRRVEHYLYRACPDGEGNCFQEGPEDVVGRIRMVTKGAWSPEYVERVRRDLDHRPFPWLVDVGGKPEAQDVPIFRACTHAILLTNSEESYQEWSDLIAQHGLILLADLSSQQTGRPSLDAITPFIRGTITNLQRTQRAVGEIVDLLVERLEALFGYTEPELRQWHLSQAPTELTLELDRPWPAIGLTDPTHWKPEQIPGLLAQLPFNEPLALYGRAANWVVGAIASASAPASLFQFVARLGWVACPTLNLFQTETEQGVSGEVAWQVHTHPDYTVLELKPIVSHLEYEQISQCRLPMLPSARGVICSGQLPLWLWTALARLYQQACWLAFYQPNLGTAVVIASRDERRPVGAHVAFTPTM